MWFQGFRAEYCRYVKMENDCIEVCGGKELGERYLLRLIHCMEKLFLEKNKVVPSLVSDVDQYVFKVAGGSCELPLITWCDWTVGQVMWGWGQKT